MAALKQPSHSSGSREMAIPLFFLCPHHSSLLLSFARLYCPFSLIFSFLFLLYSNVTTRSSPDNSLHFSSLFSCSPLFFSPPYTDLSAHPVLLSHQTLCSSCLLFSSLSSSSYHSSYLRSLLFSLHYSLSLQFFME